jgi:hypothetical protein
MATTHHWHPHVNVPVIHLHSPHVEWHEVMHPARAALASAAGVTAFAALVASTPLPSVFASSAQPTATAASQAWMPKELPREWRWQRQAVTFDHMHRDGGGGSGIDSMYSARR